ncbi:GNAT family N-acetyltransferase [Poseidonocella sp. HB161398]|uniref:GNAT family N-acetyltransferase n=1 Tax=Poseidonocella sp. HB161398 TaxID=2320855 RepID=UPI00148747D1|nr:GNAT family N-acetyltransferase [Poseidonocella sp. HB161398]
MDDTWTLRDPAPGDLGWIIAEHGRHYVGEEGFDPDYERSVAEALVNFLGQRDPGRDRIWIAAKGGAPMGSILCAGEGDEAWARFFYVHPGARGHGVGRMLLRALIDHARAQGFVQVILSTHAEQEAACRLYGRTGFTLVDSARSHAWGRPLTEQTWSLPLD